MKTFFTLCILLTSFNILNAQTTVIPDSNFEQALINLGYDSGPINGSVLTSAINGIMSLNVSSRNIASLTGIEDFTSLTSLTCHGNQLTTLDISQNTALTFLGCSTNNLTSIDVSNNPNLASLDIYSNSISSINISQNPNLRSLVCMHNQLTTINTSQNPLLEAVYCSSNQINRLNMSQNTNLTFLECYDNQLTCLNVKNGNNTNFTSFSAQNNSGLSCLEVDNVAWANSNWASSIDGSTSFSVNCSNPCIVGVEEEFLPNISIFPNPTNGFINIDLEETTKVITTLTNNLGRVIFTKRYDATKFISFDVDAPKGIYFLHLETESGTIITKKVVKK